jgi:hypothetical protein
VAEYYLRADMFSKIPPVDLFSFWLGFILATFLWIVLYQLRKLLPRLRKISQQNKIVNQLSKNVELLTKVRKHLLRRYQSFHIASNLFPLNLIYVEPGLIQNSVISDPSLEPPESPLIYSLLPNIPEAASLLFDFPVSRLLINEILPSTDRIVISGEIGSGKTSLLSNFASNILEKGKESLAFHDFLPILVHASEFDLTDLGSQDCLAILLNTVTFTNYRSQFKELFDSFDIYAKSGKLIFIVDGLDELPENEYQTTINWLVKCTNTYPDAKYIVTSGSFYIDGLEKMGFLPYAIAPLDSKQQIKLIDLWQTGWDAVFQNSVQNKTVKRFSKTWLKQENLSKSRFFLTLQILGYLSGENTFENSNEGLLTSYLSTICGNNCSLDQISDLARQIGNTNSPGLSMGEIESHFSSVKKESVNTSPPQESVQEINVANNLLNLGIFIERRAKLYVFSNLALFAFAFARKQDAELTDDWLNYLHFPINDLILRYSRNKKYLSKWLSIDDKPLHRNFTLISHHVAKLEAQSEELKLIFKSALAAIKSQPTTISSLLRVLPVFVENVQSDNNQLFIYLSNDPNPIIRKCAIIGISFCDQKQAMPVLDDLTNDQNQEVASLACISLSKFWNLRSQKILVDIILHRSESLRRVVAELFSTIEPDGHDILKELSTIDNILARKSSIYGLRMIDQDWVPEFLQNIVTQDAEWLVKDTAVHAIENYPYKKLLYQSQLSESYDYPWLIKYANTLGLGVPGDGFPFELIENVLKNGKSPEQEASIDLLGRNSDNRSIGILKSLINAQNIHSEQATEMLFKVAQRGTKIN